MFTQNKFSEYKYPIAALLWSLTLPGFGQIYNGQVILGIILLILEVASNVLSSLNLSIMETFHGDFQKAHDLINYQWGMFYPSIWGFSMWQAYNKAITINNYIDGKTIKETYLTGFFFGYVFGMNLGIYWHAPALYVLKGLAFLESPVFSGLILGIIFSLLGHGIEKCFLKKGAH